MKINSFSVLSKPIVKNNPYNINLFNKKARSSCCLRTENL